VQNGKSYDEMVASVGNLLAGASDQASELRDEMLADAACCNGSCIQEAANAEQKHIMAKSYQALLEEVDALQEVFTGIKLELEEQRQRCCSSSSSQAPGAGTADLQRPEVASLPSGGGGRNAQRDDISEENSHSQDCANAAEPLPGDSSSSATLREPARENDVDVCDWTEVVRTCNYTKLSSHDSDNEKDLDLVDLALMDGRRESRVAVATAANEVRTQEADMSTETLRSRSSDASINDVEEDRAAEKMLITRTLGDAETHGAEAADVNSRVAGVASGGLGPPLKGKNPNVESDSESGDEAEKLCETNSSDLISSKIENSQPKPEEHPNSQCGEAFHASTEEGKEEAAEGRGFAFSELEVEGVSEASTSTSGSLLSIDRASPAEPEGHLVTTPPHADVVEEDDRKDYSPYEQEHNVFQDPTPLSSSGELWKCLASEIPVGSVRALPDNEAVCDLRERTQDNSPAKNFTGQLHRSVTIGRDSLPTPQSMSTPSVDRVQSADGVDAAVVRLHVYDVSTDSRIQWLNMTLAHKYSPLKFGGIFHVGVEVYGREWCYGYTPQGTGVAWIRPRTLKDHTFRETIELPATSFSEEEADRVVKLLALKYSGRSYHLLRRNCCHFADEFCQALKVGNIPGWIHRLSGIGSGAGSFFQAIAEPLGAMRMSRSITHVEAVLPPAGGGAAALPSTPVPGYEAEGGLGL
jgi:hypothetical protein